MPSHFRSPRRFLTKRAKLVARVIEPQKTIIKLSSSTLRRSGADLAARELVWFSWGVCVSAAAAGLVNLARAHFLAQVASCYGQILQFASVVVSHFASKIKCDPTQAESWNDEQNKPNNNDNARAWRQCDHFANASKRTIQTICLTSFVCATSSSPSSRIVNEQSSNLNQIVMPT